MNMEINGSNSFNESVRDDEMSDGNYESDSDDEDDEKSQ